MSSLWCKLWNFFLNMFTSAVKAVAYALETVGGVLVDLASAAIKGVSSLLSSPLLLIGAGVAAFLLFSGKKNDGNDKVIVNRQVEGGSS